MCVFKLNINDKIFHSKMFLVFIDYVHKCVYIDFIFFGINVNKVVEKHVSFLIKILTLCMGMYVYWHM